jgi:hypothetical protein
MRRYRRAPHRGLLGFLVAAIALTVLLAAAAGGDAAYTIGPF